MNENLESDLFVAKCMELEGRLREVLAAGWTEREMVACLTALLGFIVSKQKNTELALELAILTLKSSVEEHSR